MGRSRGHELARSISNCEKCDKNPELEKYYKNPGRVFGMSNVFSQFYDVYIDDLMDKLLIKVPKVCNNKIKFTTIFFPDKKQNSYSNSELDNGDLYIPELITDADYSFAGRNTMSFADNNEENPRNPLIYLTVRDLQQELNKPLTSNVELYDGHNFTFRPEVFGCCSYYIDFLPYVKKQVALRYYSKLQIILENLENDASKTVPSFNDFLSLFSMEVTQIRVFAMNIQINLYVRMTDLSSNPYPINELVSYYIVTLPETPMTARNSVSNVGYFTVGQNITRLRLENERRIYMDPSIPIIYKNIIKEGVELYNDVFETFLTSRPFKLIAYDDPDFPDDYDKHDLRYSRIASSSNVNSSYTGLASTIVDGRSGEILWFQVMIQTDSILEVPLISTNNTGMKISMTELFRPNLSKKILTRKNLLTKIKMPCCAIYDKYKLDASDGNFELYLKNVVMHELGHCLGLRHNFAGSLAGDTSTNGSIMDYPPIFDSYNDPITDTVNIATLGDYDVIALTYGYSDEIPDLSDVPLYLTDEDMEIDPRCSVYDNGTPLDWAQTEYDNYIIARERLLSAVQEGAITNWEYTNLWLFKYLRLIKGSVDIMTRYLGSYMLNGTTATTGTRVECYMALSYIMRFLGQYRSDIVVDPLLENNVVSYVLVPTVDELEYLTGSNRGSPFPLGIVQQNIDYLILSNLLNLNRLNRINDLEQSAEINGTTYNTGDVITNAPYMSLTDFLYILSFTPGIALGDINDFPNLTMGEPYLYLPFDSTYRLRFTNSYLIPYSGIYLEDSFVPPPYPMNPPPGVSSLIQEPMPIVTRGLFPEIILSGEISNTSGLSGIRVRDSYFSPLLVNIPINLMKRRIIFLDILNSILPNVNDSVRDIIYGIVDTIATIYDTTNVRTSLITKTENLGGRTEDVAHMIAIFEKCTAIKNQIFANVQNVQNINVLSKLFFSAKKSEIPASKSQNVSKKEVEQTVTYTTLNNNVIKKVENVPKKIENAPMKKTELTKTKNSQETSLKKIESAPVKKTQENSQLNKLKIIKRK